MSTSDNDPPGRWRRDGDEENAEAHRAHEQDRLSMWERAQRMRPLRDKLAAHGMTHDPNWRPHVEVDPGYEDAYQHGEYVPATITELDEAGQPLRSYRETIRKIMPGGTDDDDDDPPTKIN